MLAAGQKPDRGVSEYPLFGRVPHRVWTRTLVCLLSYYLEWHLRWQLAPLLYEEEDRATSERPRAMPVTQAKQWRRETAEGETARGFRGQLGELRTLQRNGLRFQVPGQSAQPEVRLSTEPSALQRRVFELLELRWHPQRPSAATSSELPKKATTVTKCVVYRQDECILAGDTLVLPPINRFDRDFGSPPIARTRERSDAQTQQAVRRRHPWGLSHRIEKVAPPGG